LTIRVKLPLRPSPDAYARWGVDGEDKREEIGVCDRR
jgi:hypothetical protein